MSIVPKVATMRATAVEHVPRAITWLLVGMFVIATFLLMLVGSFAYLHLHHGVFRQAARVIPFPAMVVDGDVVWYREISERANALEVLAGLGEQEAVVQAVVLAKRHAALLALAKTLQVDVASEERDVFVASDDALIRLREDANWSARDYLRFGVASYLTVQKIEEAALADASLQAVARAKAERIQEKRRQGIPFANLATQYSEGQIVSTSKSFLVPLEVPEEWMEFVMTAAVGDESAILESATSFWLLRLDDRLTDDEGAGSVMLQAIEIKKDLFADIVQDRVDASTVVQFLR